MGRKQICNRRLEHAKRFAARGKGTSAYRISKACCPYSRRASCMCVYAAKLASSIDELHWMNGRNSADPHKKKVCTAHLGQVVVGL